MLDSEGREPFLRTLRDLLNTTYGDHGGKASIKNGKIIFEQSRPPTETDPGFYTRLTISMKVETRS